MRWGMRRSEATLSWQPAFGRHTRGFWACAPHSRAGPSPAPRRERTSRCLVTEGDPVVEDAAAQARRRVEPPAELSRITSPNKR